MIHWCAYCQKHLGEIAPYDRFEISHGICKTCLEGKVLLDREALDRIRPVAAYYQKIADAYKRSESPSELLEEGLQLGLDPWDLLVGILQPALRSMGERWAQAAATVAEEHQLTAACAEILALMKARQPEVKAMQESASPEVLLVNAEGNSHALGLQMVEFYLAAHSVPVMALQQGLPAQEVLQIVASARPRTVGISCALPAQLASVCRTAEAIAALPEEYRPRVFVGGFALRSIQELPKDWAFIACRTPADLLHKIQAPVPGGAPHRLNHEDANPCRS
jgi:methanogenic corrinoid protein MtbC1